MSKLQRSDLMSLEEYATQRVAFRDKVMAHKKTRHIHLGEHATLYFEDSLTMQYQVQEMLRVERIFEEEGIMEELNAYNPLIPDGKNLKATFMIEYADESERREALAKMIGIEDKVWVQVDGFAKVYAIADEDMERDTEEKTSAVHFLRFEFDDDMVAAAKKSTNIAMGIEHTAYTQILNPISNESKSSLVADFA
ncbi:Hypothetical protein in Rubrerythrin cluster [hydrothermal vent metagenome]|uniref:DUF3501 domain-containing protein n=1 Tax=hydrothermal vent metagenome TaxID=652676 RepID=A0A3B1A9Z8_9ZZZZ